MLLGSCAPLRFTPTRVGTTSTRSTVTITTPVHPHARGDNHSRAYSTAKAPGSPPRAWGQPTRLVAMPRVQRFTPTRVGTTAVIPSLRAFPIGSPPRAWGQRNRLGATCFPSRFTPTRVGTTSSRTSSLPSEPVHPHARGDNVVRKWRRTCLTGSPPRAWGQPARRRGRAQPIRFTPTRVGTTPSPMTSRSAVAVHPHARGDNNFSTLRIASATGSPPRAWGQHLAVDPTDMAGRFTPTRVGTTRPPNSGSNRVSVHPHARGDNTNETRMGQGPLQKTGGFSISSTNTKPPPNPFTTPSTLAFPAIHHLSRSRALTLCSNSCSSIFSCSWRNCKYTSSSTSPRSSRRI